MASPALITTEKKQEIPILIVDKEGSIGEGLAKALSEESITVYVSSKELDFKNVVHIPFHRRFPTIPDNHYSHIFLIGKDYKEIKSLTDNFIKKAKKDKSLLILAFGMTISEKETSKLINSYERTKIVILGDIFAKDKILDEKAFVNKFIYQAKKFEKISVPGDGTTETFPVFLDDVLEGLLEVVFAEKENIKLFYLFPRNFLTTLSLAHAFQRVYPNIRIDFVPEKPKKEILYKPTIEGEYLLEKNYNMDEKIRKINLEPLVDENIKVKSSYEEEDRDRFGFLGIFFFFLLFLLMPLFSFLLFLNLGEKTLNSVLSDFSKDYVISTTKIELSIRSFEIANASSQVLYEEIKYFGLGEKILDLREKINSYSDTSNAILSFANANSSLANILLGESKDQRKDMAKVVVDLKSFLLSLDKEEKNFNGLAQNLRDYISFTSSTLDSWPEILGFKGVKTYLILLQDNQKIRPGGGFIENVATITINSGKITKFEVEDTKTLDANLSGRAEPPFALRRYMALKNWNLENSNFDLDFSKGAVASAVFLNSEKEQPVDGVLGLDLYFFKSVLSVSGPVLVLGESISSENMLEKIKNRDTQFMEAFYKEVFRKMGKRDVLKNLFLILPELSYEKHMVYAFNNPSLQSIFSINGLSSSLERSIKKENEIADFIGVSEASLGEGNSTNVIKDVSQEVFIENDGSVREKLFLGFKNQNQGVYKSYVRVILPKESELSSITIDDKTQKIVEAISDPSIYEKENFKTPSGIEIERNDLENFTSYGFLLLLNGESTKKIRLEYTLSDKFDFSNPDFNYNLEVFKQPGTDYYYQSVSFKYPDKLFISKTKDQNLKEKGKTLLKVLRDINLSLTLSPK